MNQLHPGVKWQFRLTAYIVLIFLSFFVSWIIVPAIWIFLSLITGEVENIFPLVAVLSAFFYLVIIILVGEIYARMAYNRWFYEFKEDGLRLERGIIWKRYSNVPYERIQNVDIHRGIIARIFGFSSLMIQTAGYSGYPNSEGYIPALEINLAEQLRSKVMKKITKRNK